MYHKILFIISLLIFPIVSLAYAHTDLENAKLTTVSQQANTPLHTENGKQRNESKAI